MSLPDYEPLAHNGNRVRNAIHRAEYWALKAERAHANGALDCARVETDLADVWVRIAVATAQTFGER